VAPEAYRYFAARLNDLLLFFQGAHALHEAGNPEDDPCGPYLDFVAASVSTPGGARYWRLVAFIYTPRMVEALDARIARGDVYDVLRLLPRADEPAA